MPEETFLCTLQVASPTVRIGTNDNISFLENNVLKLFLVESGRENWVRQVYKMRDINGKYHETVCHKLLL
jgi:hypothetical protein